MKADPRTAELAEAKAEAAELMADEAHDLVISLMGVHDWDEISDRVKDYMHDWAARFRAGEAA